MTNPTAIRNAKKIAEDAAGRKLPYDRVWIEKPSASAYNEYSVRYTIPREHGFFVCNEPLWLDAEEFAQYEAWIQGQ